MPTQPDHIVCRDGRTPEPIPDAGLEGVRRALRHYDSTDLIPRLLATVDALRGL